MSNVKIYRVASASSATETDDGEYIYIAFDYVGGDAGSGNIPPTCVITIDGTQVYNNTFSSASGTFATGSSPANFGTYSKDTTHDVTVKIYDSNYVAGVIYSVNIPTATYGLDFVGSGTSIYVGVNHVAINGQDVTVPELYSDDLFVLVDETAASGTDHDLYTALTALGWWSDVTS